MNKPLPQKIEAEQSLLSAMLIDSEACEEALSILKPNDFYQTSHQIIFKACQDLYRKKQPADLTTVASYLKDNKQLDQAKGASYLAYLVDQVPLATNVEHYARIVKEKALLRNILFSGNKIISLVQESTDNPVEILDKAQRLMLDIKCERQGGYSQLSDLLDEGIDRYEALSKRGEGVTGINSGYSDLDRLTCGFQPSDLIIIAGRPGMGKSALMINMARSIALSGRKVGVFSLEMSKSQITDRLNAIESGVNSLKFRSGRFTKDDWIAIVDGIDKLYDLDIYINDDSLTHMELRRGARLMKKAGIEIIFVDYLGLMVGEKGYGRVEEVSSITRSLKACAKELDIPVVALSQLNRSVENRDNNNKRPRLSDLRDSGAIEQDADLVIFIYRDEVYNEFSPDRGIAELNIAKQRNGPTGTVKLCWNKFTTRFDAIYMGDDVV